jgi:hypothetical protein
MESHKHTSLVNLTCSYAPQSSKYFLDLLVYMKDKSYGSILTALEGSSLDALAIKDLGYNGTREKERIQGILKR